MSHTATVSIDRNPPTASQLLDVLYEVLASGLEPEGARASSDDIEAFLHQHARAPKTRSDIDAFFQSHGLPMQLERYSHDSGLRLAPVSPPAVTPPPIPMAAATTPVARSSPLVTAIPVVSNAFPNARLWAALGVVSLALLVASVLGGFALMNLRQEVARSNANQRALLTALDGLKTRTQHVDTRLDAQSQQLKSTHAELDGLMRSFFPATE